MWIKSFYLSLNPDSPVVLDPLHLLSNVRNKCTYFDAFNLNKAN